MKNRGVDTAACCPDAQPTSEPLELPAGPFSEWLHTTLGVLEDGGGGANVQCGDCTACCRSSYFIHIRAHEHATLKHVPRALLFPAAGLHDGTMLLGYDENGRCPMMVRGKCVVYAHRPQTCRDFDCRIFAATGIGLDDGAQPRIAAQARRWRFDFPAELDRREAAAVRAAGAFLAEHPSHFPPDSLPKNPVPLAVLALRAFRLFVGGADESHQTPDSAIADAILDLLRKGERSSIRRGEAPQSRRKPTSSRVRGPR